MSILSKKKNIFTSNSGTGGGGGVSSLTNASVSGISLIENSTGVLKTLLNGTNIQITNNGDGTISIDCTADDIIVVANYSALPAASTVIGEFYWCSASQGTAWLPGSIGGTYYSAGLYYSNGVNWEFLAVPYQATQTEVNTGTNTDKFVTPNTFANASKWSNYLTTSSASSTYVPQTRTITINGTSQDLSSNRSWTVSGNITVGVTTISSGTSGRIAFNGSGLYAESAYLLWDNSNNNLFTASAQGNPGTSGSSLSGVGFRIGNTTGGITGSALDFGQNGTNGSWLQARLGSNYASNQNFMINPNGGYLLVNATTQTNLSAANGLTQGIYLKNGASGIGTLTYGVGGMMIETSYNSNLYPAFLISTAGANNALCVSSAGNMQLGGVAPAARIHLPASDTTYAHLRLTAGSTPSSPGNGDIWFDGTNIYIRIGGVTKTFTVI